MIFGCVAAVILLYLLPITYSTDETSDWLWRDTVPRLILSIGLVVFIFVYGFGQIFCVRWGEVYKNIVWCLPCFAVVIVNFPFSALMNGSAVIERIDLLWLFLLKCALIALSEELLFRGIMLGIFRDVFNGKRHTFIYCILLSSVVFALFHFFNIAEGASVSATLLQVGYTFLTGIMFAAVTIKTKNIWGATVLHFIFDVGGLIVNDLGYGSFQDGIFWTLTIVCAIICAIHLIIYAVEQEKLERMNIQEQEQKK